MNKTIAKILVVLMTLFLVPANAFAGEETQTSASEWGIYTCNYNPVTGEATGVSQTPVDDDVLDLCHTNQGGTYAKEEDGTFKKVSRVDEKILIAGYYENGNFVPIKVNWEVPEENQKFFNNETVNNNEFIYRVKVKPVGMGRTLAITATDEHNVKKQAQIHNQLLFWNGATIIEEDGTATTTKLEVGKKYYAQYGVGLTDAGSGYSTADKQDILQDIKQSLTAKKVNCLCQDNKTKTMLDESKIMFGDDIEYTMYMPDSVAETDWDAVVKVPFTVTGDIENTSYIYFGYEGECFSRAGSVRTLDIYLSNASVKFTEPGQTKQIQLFQKGEDKTTDAATTWSSADETVATVEAGLITSKGTGKTKISATYNKKTVSCSVRCYKDGIYIGDITTDSRPVKEYEFDASSAGNPKLQLWIYKNTTNYTQETWLSSNTDIAEITSGIQVEPLPGGGTTAIPNGKLTFKKNGTVTIYAAGRSLDDVWGSCTFKVTGFPRDSDYETGWVALNDYQMGHIYQQGIKLSNHDIMTQSFNQMFFENRLTAPVKADGCEFVIQLTSSAKNEGGGNGGGGGSSLADNMANPENQKILIDSAKENLSLWKMENDKRTEKVASVGDGLTLKDTDFDTSGNMVVTHRLSVDKGVLQKGQTYALLASGGIKAYTSGSLNKEAQYQFETLAPAKNIALNKDNLTLREGASETLTALLNEGLEDEADDLVIWTSSDDTVADVDNNGKVTAKKAGTATITATAKDGKVSADCAVTVIADPATQGGQNTGTTGSDQQIPVTGITLDKAKATMYVGKTRILKATVAPANASDKTVTWKSSKPKVAKVDKNGKVTARAAGKATITATTKDGGYTAKAVITVKTAKAKGVKLDRTAVTLTVGKARTLKATVLPDKATNKAVTWKSSDSRIAKVSRGGKVLGVAPGTATITVTTKDGGFAKKAWITVRPAVASFTLTAKKGSATIHYKKVKGVSGYEIYRADSKQGKYYKITTRTQRQKGICASSKLKTKHTYYYKVRTYKTVKGKKIYSSFSAVKKIKTK